jgi:hypothetical protein
MASTLALAPTRRRALSQDRGEQARLLIAVALLIVVLIAEAAVILAAPNFPDITSLYIATT